MSADQAPEIPFTYRREIFWGDTDAARIVYTGRFVDYMFEAAESWMRAYIGTDWFTQTVDEERGGPIAHMEFDFFARVSPRDTLSLEVLLDRIGDASLTFQVDGYANGEILAFTGQFVTVGFDYKAKAKLAISPERRAIMESYKAACDEVIKQRSETG